MFRVEGWHLPDSGLSSQRTTYQLDVGRRQAMVVESESFVDLGEAEAAGVTWREPHSEWAADLVNGYDAVLWARESEGEALAVRSAPAPQRRHVAVLVPVSPNPYLNLSFVNLSIYTLDCDDTCCTLHSFFIYDNFDPSLGDVVEGRRNPSRAGEGLVRTLYLDVGDIAAACEGHEGLPNSQWEAFEPCDFYALFSMRTRWCDCPQEPCEEDCCY